MTSYLKIDHVDKVFARGGSRETEVLKGITLTIEQGRVSSPIIGHSGCGKSTIAQHRSPV